MLVDIRTCQNTKMMDLMGDDFPSGGGVGIRHSLSEIMFGISQPIHMRQEE